MFLLSSFLFRSPALISWLNLRNLCRKMRARSTKRSEVQHKENKFPLLFLWYNFLIQMVLLSAWILLSCSVTFFVGDHDHPSLCPIEVSLIPFSHGKKKIRSGGDKFTLLFLWRKKSKIMVLLNYTSTRQQEACLSFLYSRDLPFFSSQNLTQIMHHQKSKPDNQEMESKGTSQERDITKRKCSLLLSLFT